MQLAEAILTKHYNDRKAERGTITNVEVQKAAYGEYDVEETNQKLIPLLQAKLDEKLTEIEAKDFPISTNYNVGLCAFMPILINGDSKHKIKMTVTNGDEGTFYLDILTDNKLVTIYPMSATSTKEVEEVVHNHTKRKYPENNKDVKVLFPQSSIVEINIDELYGKEVKKAGEQKVSQDVLDYKVRTDYRVGATFDHKQFGPGKIVAADKGGKAGPDGRIDWVDVKYAKPFMKGGKLQDVRRFNNILTAAYFGKTMKEASEEIKCKECGHHWKFADGGKHPYLCKCGHDNTPIQKEMHTMKDDNYDEHHQLRADVEETDNYCPHCLAEYIMERVSKLEEAEYRGRKVSLGKPFLTPGGPKKRSVYVKNAKGNVVKVNFGDPNMRIKKSIPARRKSYRARHHCQSPGPRWKANYWSCRAW